MARPEPFDESLHALAESLVAIHARLLSFDDACGWVDASKHEGALKSPVGVAAATRLGEVRAEVERRVHAVETALSRDVLHDADIELIRSLHLDETFERMTAEILDVLVSEAANDRTRQETAHNARKQAREREDNARARAREMARRQAEEPARRDSEAASARWQADEGARRRENARQDALRLARWLKRELGSLVRRVRAEGNLGVAATVLFLGGLLVWFAVAWSSCRSSHHSAETNSVNTVAMSTDRAWDLQPAATPTPAASVPIREFAPPKAAARRVALTEGQEKKLASVAGTLEAIQIEVFMQYEVRLAGRTIAKTDANNDEEPRFMGPAPRFVDLFENAAGYDQVVAIEWAGGLQNACTGYAYTFLGLRRDGTYHFSEDVPFCSAPDATFSLSTGDTILLTIPDHPPIRGTGMIKGEKWLFAGGNVRKL
jgi:hypothetical protein